MEPKKNDGVIFDDDSKLGQDKDVVIAPLSRDPEKNKTISKYREYTQKLFSIEMLYWFALIFTVSFVTNFILHFISGYIQDQEYYANKQHSEKVLDQKVTPRQ